MKRRTSQDHDPDAMAHWAAELAWWTSRARTNTPLNPAERARYRALRDQHDDPAADSVARDLTERWADPSGASGDAPAHQDPRLGSEQLIRPSQGSKHS